MGTASTVWRRLLETSTREVFEMMLGETAGQAVSGEDEGPSRTDFTALVGLSSDALGEIANMVAGNFKSKLPGMADACRLSVPTVFYGTELTRDPVRDGESLESCFLFNGQPFWVNLNLWPDSDAGAANE